LSGAPLAVVFFVAVVSATAVFGAADEDPVKVRLNKVPPDLAPFAPAPPCLHLPDPVFSPLSLDSLGCRSLLPAQVRVEQHDWWLFRRVSLLNASILLSPCSYCLSSPRICDLCYYRRLFQRFYYCSRTRCLVRDLFWARRLFKQTSNRCRTRCLALLSTVEILGDFQIKTII
jgi:hypothetical protein